MISSQRGNHLLLVHSTNIPEHPYCDVIISESIPKEVRVEVDETPKRIVFKIATELLTTEREYVRVLGLIEMVSHSTFHKALDDVPTISNILY